MDAAAEQQRPARGDHSLAAVILGNDALVAARPCTPAQLANACIAAGFDLVVPPMWGDELVATAYLERLAVRHEPVIIACACPRVAALTAQVGTTLPQLALAAPPVAVARALRAVHGEAILITYVGACPSASDTSIDVRFSPSALFAQLDRQAVKIAEQPPELVGAHHDRWHRYASVPGGLPALRFLARPPVDRVLRTLDAVSLARGEMRPSRSHVLVDLAGAAQCACGGARDEIEEGEPRRSTTPVVQCPLGLPLDAEPTPRPRRAVSLRGPTRAADTAVGEATYNAAQPAAVGAPVVGTGGTGLDTASAPSDHAPRGDASGDDTPGVGHGLASRTSLTGGARRAREAARRVDEEPANISVVTPGGAVTQARRRALALVPAVVLVLAGALGVAVYAAGVSSAGSGARDSAGAATDATGATPGGDPSTPAGRSAASPASRDSSPDDAVSATAQVVPDPTARAAVDSVAPHDSVRTGARRRPRRASAPAVVPGWMPQGRPAFVPRDSVAASPDSSANRPGPDSVRSESTRAPA